MVYRPMCGSDGKTYASKCELDVADCLSDGNVKKIHDGKCSKWESFCYGDQVLNCTIRCKYDEFF